MQQPLTFPFSAIVSLDDLRLALLLNAVNPKIGGLLIRGPKGSGKTTAVRALADILPKIKVVEDSPFNCSPDDPTNMCDECHSLYMKNGSLSFEERKMRIVDLPLGATEDRVVGSLDVEKAVKMGIEALEPGILAQANQNTLYVDEVNLLPDHIADDLLDAAATGWNVVEREGISVKHPSRFIFVGTMNPEEGQLRPQLLDRFPLSADATRVSIVKDRIEIVKRNMEFEADPETFVKRYSANQEKLRNKIVQARKILSEVQISDALIGVVSAACLELKVDGVRPDIVIAKTAKTLAAFENQTIVTPEHVMKAAQLALNHRTREGGFLEPASPQEINETLATKLKEAKYSPSHEGKTWEKVKGKKETDKPTTTEEKKRYIPPFGFRKLTGKEKDMGKTRDPEGQVSSVFQGEGSSQENGRFLLDSRSETGGKSAPFAKDTKWASPELAKGTSFLDRIRESKLLSLKFSFKARKTSKHAARDVGKRAETVTTTHRGRGQEWRIPKEKPSDIHFPATIRAAAKLQRFRDKPSEVALAIYPEDIREKLRIYRAPMTIVFVLDLSESMLKSLDDVKEAMLKLHSDAYRYRDKVGLVVFKDMGAVVVQHPTSNLRLVTNKLLRLRMSGFTPLAGGMLKALEVLKEAKRRDASAIPVMVIVTDGDANVPLKRDLLTGEIREFDVLDAAFFEYEEQAMKDVFSVSEMIKKEGVHTVVVGMTPKSTDTQSMSTGSIATRMIASITEGVYHEVSGRVVDNWNRSDSEISEVILRAQRQISQFH